MKTFLSIHNAYNAYGYFGLGFISPFTVLLREYPFSHFIWYEWGDECVEQQTKKAPVPKYLIIIGLERFLDNVSFTLGSGNLFFYHTSVAYRMFSCYSSYVNAYDTFAEKASNVVRIVWPSVDLMDCVKVLD